MIMGDGKLIKRGSAEAGGRETRGQEKFKMELRRTVVFVFIVEKKKKRNKGKLDGDKRLRDIII